MPSTEAFQIDQDTQVFIETTDVPLPPGIELVSRSDSGAVNFSEAADRALPVARMLVDKLQGVASNVKEIEVEFGLKLSGEVGALIAKTGTEANFRIKLVWDPTQRQAS